MVVLHVYKGNLVLIRRALHAFLFWFCFSLMGCSAPPIPSDRASINIIVSVYADVRNSNGGNTTSTGNEGEPQVIYNRSYISRMLKIIVAFMVVELGASCWYISNRGIDGIAGYGAAKSASSSTASANSSVSKSLAELEQEWCFNCRSGDPGDGGVAVPTGRMCAGYCTRKGYCGAGGLYSTQEGVVNCQGHYNAFVASAKEGPDNGVAGGNIGGDVSGGGGKKASDASAAPLLLLVAAASSPESDALGKRKAEEEEQAGAESQKAKV